MGLPDSTAGTAQPGMGLLPYREVDQGELLELLTDAIPDAGARRAVLADNPVRLYGFGPLY
jgi:predicted TIM-barrel fold metal-dependent hydrolase